MDPNETLRMIRDYARKLDALRDAKDRNDSDAVRQITATETLEDMAYALAEHVEALDEWMSRGGLDPSDWVVPGRRL